MTTLTVTIEVRGIPRDSALAAEIERVRRCWGGEKLDLPTRATYAELRELLAVELNSPQATPSQEPPAPNPTRPHTRREG